MAKIGTAQVEIKPVLNEEALKEVTDRIEAGIREAVERGMTHRTVIGWDGDNIPVVQ